MNMENMENMEQMATIFDMGSGDLKDLWDSSDLDPVSQSFVENWKNQNLISLNIQYTTIDVKQNWQ